MPLSEQEPDRSAAPDFRSRSWRCEEPAPGAVEPLHGTLLSAWRSAARFGEDRGITLLADDPKLGESHRTYADLHAESRRVAASLRAAGIRAGDRVLVVLPTSFAFVTTFFGVMLAGAVPVPSYPPAAFDKVETALARLRHIADHCGAAACVTSGQLLPMLGELGLTVPSLRRMLTAEALASASDREASAPDLRPEDPAFIQYTSGSTGNPKGVVLTHRNVTANVHAFGVAFEINRRDVAVSWLPLYHDMGLIGSLLGSVYWRLPLVLMSPVAFLMRPARWLRAIHDHRGTLSAAPNFAFALCVKRIRAKDREGLDLSTWRIALNGAEPIHAGILRDFEATYGAQGFRPESMFPVYGLAESSLAVTFPRPGSPPRVVRVARDAMGFGARVTLAEEDGAAALVCVGKAIPGHEVRIVGEDGAPLEEGRVGHIVVQGPSVMAGYYGAPELSAAALRDGWLWTGDLGFFHDESLYVTGREKDLVIARGKNYYAEDIERVAEAVPGVRPGGAVAFAVRQENDEGGAECAVMVCETNCDEAEREALSAKVIDAIADAIGLVVAEVVLVEPGTLPKTSSGKRQRGATRDRYLTGELVAQRTSKLKLAMTVARSGLGFLAMMTKRLSQPPSAG